jgi:Skp family chaperone for outer membrane proteins
MTELDNMFKRLNESLQSLTKLVEKVNGKLETASKRAKAPAPEPNKQAEKKKRIRRPSANPESAAAEKKPEKVKLRMKRAKKGKSDEGGSIVGKVQNVIENTPGINFKSIQEKTGFEAKQIQNTVFMLKKRGKIKADGRGVYYPVLVEEQQL